MTSRATIDRFLACRRLAVVGVSRDPRDFSRSVFRAFTDRGYDRGAGRLHGFHRFLMRLTGRLES